MRIGKTDRQVLISLLGANDLSVVGKREVPRDRVAKALVKSVYPSLQIPLCKLDFAIGHLPATGVPEKFLETDGESFFTIFEAGVAGLTDRRAPEAGGAPHKVEIVSK